MHPGSGRNIIKSTELKMKCPLGRKHPEKRAAIAYKASFMDLGFHLFPLMYLTDFLYCYVASNTGISRTKTSYASIPDCGKLYKCSLAKRNRIGLMCKAFAIKIQSLRCRSRCDKQDQWVRDPEQSSASQRLSYRDCSR